MRTTDTTLLVRSPHLVTRREGEEHVVYHALLGHPMVVNAQGLAVLESFATPSSIAALTERCSIPGLRRWIRGFTDAHFLVRRGTNERAALARTVQRGLARISQGKELVGLGLILSEACNFDCSYCVSKQILRASQRSGPAFLRMPWPVAQRAIDAFLRYAKQQKHREVEIHFGGSEPLLNWTVLQQCIQHCEETYGKSFRFRFSANSNGSLIDADRARYLARHKVSITTSLDGLQETNDVSRTHAGGRGTFDEIIKGWDHLGRVRKPVRSFSLTLTDKNIDAIDATFFDFLQARGIRSCTIEPDLIKPLAHTPEEVVAALMRFRRLGEERGVNVVGMWDRPFKNLFQSDARPKPTTDPFSAGPPTLFNCSAFTGRGVSVRPNGAIVSCAYTTGTIGTIDDISGLFRTPAFQSLIASRAVGNIDACRGCEIEGLCRGGCYLTSVYGQLAGTQTGFDYRCDVYRRATRALIHEAATGATPSAIPTREEVTP